MEPRLKIEHFAICELVQFFWMCDVDL